MELPGGLKLVLDILSETSKSSVVAGLKSTSPPWMASRTNRQLEMERTISEFTSSFLGLPLLLDGPPPPTSLGPGKDDFSTE